MKTLTIGSDTFTVDLIDPWESFLLEPLIMPIVADLVPAVMAGMSTAQEQAGERPLGDLNIAEILPVLDAIAPQVGAALARVTPKLLDEVSRKLLQNATMNGAPLFSPVAGGGDPIRILLRGKTLIIWKLLFAAMRENYADFFVLLGRDAASKAAGSSATSRASAQPGPAGGS